MGREAQQGAEAQRRADAEQSADAMKRANAYPPSPPPRSQGQVCHFFEGPPPIVGRGTLWEGQAREPCGKVRTLWEGQVRELVRAQKCGKLKFD